VTITQIENGIKKLLKNFSQDSFVFDFLLAYGEPKATITRLKKGDLNQLEQKGELTQRKKLFFKEVASGLYGVIDTLISDTASQKQKPRFIIVTDYETLLAYDTKTTDTLDIKLSDLAKHYDFFLPLAGMEKAAYVDENPADVKASNRLAKLYDEILKNNPIETHEEVHTLNVFLTRLLFCYFAEDSNIFNDNAFTNSISNYTQVDGSDLDSYLYRLFTVFNTDDKDRKTNLPEYLKAFPFVNGGLFRESYPIPKFTMKSRNILIDIGKLDWSKINPDIFGSMMQAVVTLEHRGNIGMHYTSVPNIMKVIQPLFLDELYEEFEKSKTSKKKLQELINRIANLKIFDPACGSGNFLIIAYKELRRLEIMILKQINKVSRMKKGKLFGSKSREQLSFLSLSSSIELTQFYGIELDDFAHEVAILSLWLTEHQMNREFFQEFGQTAPPLPLKNGGNIVHGNATRIDWESACPKENEDEIYILGNPPYLGSSMQNKEQKEDMTYLLSNKLETYKNLDYISCWFVKASDYIRGINSKYAFVSTNSITQGEQVDLLWPYIFSNHEEIYFAHTSFKWQNNAKAKAAVIVCIIGIRNNISSSKNIITNNIIRTVKNISPYLIAGNNITVQRNGISISKFPDLVRGSMPTDDGNFILTLDEKNKLLEKYPSAEKFIKQYMSGGDFLNGKERWCLWITDEDLEEAEQYHFIKHRLEAICEFRLKSKASSTRDYAKFYNRFRQISYKETPCIIIPLTSSERRKYIPCSFLSNPTVVTNSAGVIYDAEPWIMGILSSHIHMVWMRVIAGRLKTDYRYSSALVYNNFPFPNISDKQKEEITELVFNILDEREQHSEKTLAQLYDPDKMPQGLNEAHHQLDLAIEKCYRNKPFESDEERLEYLFKLYEEMTSGEKK